MPRQNWGNDRNINRLPLPQEIPQNVICVRVYIPASQYFMNTFIGSMNRLAKQIYYERDELHTAKNVAEVWKSANMTTFEGLGNTCDGTPIQFQPDSEPYQYVASSYEQQLQEIMEIIDMKFSIDGKLYEPAIPLVECGCGAESDTSAESDTGGTTGTGISGSTVGNVFDNEVTTLCDMISTGTDWIIDSVDDAVGRIASYAWVIDVIQFVDDIIIASWIDDVRSAATDIENELLDSDFRIILENAIAKYFDDPIIKDISRFGLYRFALKIPLVFEGAPMRAAFILWALGTNMQNFNDAVKSWAGTGTQEACAGAFQRIGRTQYNPPNGNPTGTYSFTAASQTEYSIDIFQLGTPYTPSTQSVVDIGVQNRTFVGSGIVLSDFIGIANANAWRTARVIASNISTNDIIIDAVPIDLDVYAFDGYVSAELTAIDIEDIQQFVFDLVGIASVDDTIAATIRTSTTSTEIGYGCVGTSAPQSGGIVDYLWIVHRAT